MNEILNFYQITKSVAISGQPTESQFKNIAADDYEIVVNLGMHNSDNALVNEGNVVASLDMSYVHLPIPFESPNASHVRDFFKVMEIFEGKKIFVHCVVNARASALMYKYLTLKKGLCHDDATSPVLKKWRPSMDQNWRSILELTISEIEL